jgi:DNA-binding transcriptional LysR family regulator
MKLKLRVGVSSTPAEAVMPLILPELPHALPDLDISFHTADSVDICQDVLGGRLDLGIVGAYFQNEDLVCEPFLEGDKLVVIVPPGSLLAQSGKVSIRQLNREPFIGRRRGSGTRLTYEPVLAAAGVPLASLQVVDEVGDTAASIEEVANGKGISIVSLLAAREAVMAGRVKALELEHLTLVRNLYVITRAKAGAPEARTEFLGFLKRWRDRCHWVAAAASEGLAACMLEVAEEGVADSP